MTKTLKLTTPTITRPVQPAPSSWQVGTWTLTAPVSWRPDTQAQRDKWLELGGARWVKRLINEALKS